MAFVSKARAGASSTQEYPGDCPASQALQEQGGWEAKATM